MEPSPAVAQPPSRTLCAVNEKPLFSCPIGGNLVSVCAAGGKATYRFGRPGRIELTSGSLTQASRGYSGGGETQISAANAGFVYTVFDRTTRTAFRTDGRHDAAFTNGLLVRRGGRTILSRKCGGEPVLASRDTEQIVPGGTFVEH